MEETMSATPVEGTQDGNPSGEPTAAQFEAITSQEALDGIVGDRVKRERAKFSDYGDLQAKPSRLDWLPEPGQPETEKANKRATHAESERDDARAEAIRLRVAVEHGI